MDTGLHLQRHEVDNPPASTTKVRDGWNHTIAPLYVFITLRIINYRHFTCQITNPNETECLLVASLHLSSTAMGFRWHACGFHNSDNINHFTYSQMIACLRPLHRVLCYVYSDVSEEIKLLKPHLVISKGKQHVLPVQEYWKVRYKGPEDHRSSL
jgi:hypothetical protein